MSMPPIDLASGDKHAPVKPAAARPPAVALPSAIGLEVRPSFWLVRATIETPTPPRAAPVRSPRRAELAFAHGFASPDERTPTTSLSKKTVVVRFARKRTSLTV
jgi:hypothetical protein